MASIHGIVVRPIIVLAVVALLAACQAPARLVVARGSTASNLAFIFSAWSDSTPGRLRSVYVHRCIEPVPGFPEMGERVWSIWVHPDDASRAPTVGRIEYGRSFGVLRTGTEPQPLAPGCYIAQAWGDFPEMRGGVTVFRVSPFGEVTSDDA